MSVISDRRGLWIVIGVALLARLAAAFYLGNTVSGLSGAHDEISYSMLGHRWAQGYGLTFPQPWYPWIQPDAPQSYYSATISLFYGLIYKVFGYQPLLARLITALLSTAVVGMLYLLCERLFGAKVAFVAGLIAAGYAYLVFYGVTLLTETPFLLALLLAIYVAYDLRERPTAGRWVLLGIALAISLLLRMAVLFFLPVLLAWIVWAQPRADRWAQAGRSLIAIGIVVLAVLPFTVRNYQLWQRPLLLEAQFGHVLWNGNHPGHEGDFHTHEVFAIPEEVLALDNDAAITSELARRGVANILADPGHFLLLTITRLRELFTFWPTADSTGLANAMRVLSFGLLVPFAIAGLYLSAGRWRDLLPIYLFMLMHVGVYAVTWTMIRYRMPVDTFLVAFGAVAVEALLSRLWPRWRAA